MAKTLYYLFKEARPRQWIKNLTVFASIFFTGQLFEPVPFSASIWAFLIFCAASSSTYIINDLVDLEKDRLHPFKRNRPLASGALNQRVAIVAAGLLTFLALFFAFQINLPFFFLVITFFLLQISYSYYLKNIILLDIITIAVGFIIRVLAGEMASGYHLDIWLLLTVISVSLFLAIGKRRSELTLLSGWAGSIPAKTRVTLTRYSEKMLDVYISMFANSAWITYSFYSFLQKPPVIRNRINLFFDQYNLDFFQERKWLMLSIPLVIYGIMRYLQLIYEKNEGESPEKVLLTDKPLIITSAILGLVLFGTIYLIGK